MDMTEALKLADMVNDNAKEWDAARIEAFDKHREKNVELAQDAYQILTEKVEKKKQRREVARARAKRAREQRDAGGNDSAQNQQHDNGGFHES
jgi:hypothetical protein